MGQQPTLEAPERRILGTSICPIGPATWGTDLLVAPHDILQTTS
jgi:hypothetical protein